MDEVLEPSRFMVLLNSCLGLEFKGSLSLSKTSNFLLFLLFGGKSNFGFSGFRSGILLLVKVAVRNGSSFAEFAFSILGSGIASLESSNKSLSSLVGTEELLATKSGDVRVEFDHDT